MNENIKLKEKIGYAMGDTASNLIFGLVSSYSPIFFTDVALLPVGLITTLLLVARVWDAVNDPMMGVLVDRSNMKWGKYRTWFVFLPVPLLVAVVATFTVPDIGTTGKVVFAFIAYNILMMLYTAINVPYGALITTITADSSQRISFSSIRTLGATLGSLIVSGTALSLVAFFGKGDDARGYMLTAGFFGIIAVLLFYFLFFTVKERVKAETSREKGLGKDLLVVVKSPVWLLFFFMVFMVFGNMFMRISSTTYYFIYVAGRPDLIGIFFMIVTLVQIPGAILVNLLSKVMNRKKIFYFCGISSAVVFAGCYFVRNLVLFFVLEALGGILITMLIPLLAATIGDIADYFVKEKNIKAGGVISASMTLSNKLSLSIAGVLVGGLMSAAGYIPNTQQSAVSMGVINANMTIIPAVFSILFLIIAFFFPLKEGEKNS